jgi:hypothetical protein
MLAAAVSGTAGTGFSHGDDERVSDDLAMVTSDSTAAIQVSHPSAVDGDLARPDAAHTSAPMFSRHAATRSIRPSTPTLSTRRRRAPGAQPSLSVEYQTRSAASITLSPIRENRR